MTDMVIRLRIRLSGGVKRATKLTEQAQVVVDDDA